MGVSIFTKKGLKTDRAAAANDAGSSVLTGFHLKDSWALARDIIQLTQDDMMAGLRAISDLLQITTHLKQENKFLRLEQKRLLGLCHTDGLTGLYNKTYLMAALGKLSDFNQMSVPDERRETKGDRLLMIDLDKFKPINDIYGHQAGDEALKCVARMLQGNIRKTDVAARIGGDEFVVLLRGTNEKGAQAKLEKILAAFETLDFAWKDDVRIAVRASVGTCAIDQGKTAEEILQHADKHMYDVKKAKGASRE